MDVDIPKLKIPFSIDVTRQVAVLEQDSLDEIAQCVYVLLSTEIDSRIEMPDYGLPSQAFKKNGVDTEEIRETVGAWEPRVLDMEIETEWEGVLQRVMVMVNG